VGGRCWAISCGALRAGDDCHSGCTRSVLFTQLLQVRFVHAGGTHSKINVFHRTTAHFVIDFSDGDNIFTVALVNMLYLNDPSSEAVRIALIDLGYWWRPWGRMAWTSWSPHSSTWPAKRDYGQGTQWNERWNLLRMVELNCLDCENIPPFTGGMILS